MFFFKTQLVFQVYQEKWLEKFFKENCLNSMTELNNNLFDSIKVRGQLNDKTDKKGILFQQKLYILIGQVVWVKIRKNGLDNREV